MTLTSDERRRQAFLEWLFDRGPGKHHVNPFHESIGSTPLEAFEDLEYLKREGHARVEHHGGGANYAEITSDGRIEVEQLRETLADVPARNRVCRREMLRWLYRVGARGESGSHPTWQEFTDDSSSNYLESPFTSEEIEENAAWLRDKKFIDGPTVDEFAGPIRPYLTSVGIDCVERADGEPGTAGGVRTSSPTRDTHINVHGGNVQIATGDHVSQNLNVDAEVERIAALLDSIVELLGSLGVEELAELRRLKVEAIEGLRSEPPTASGIRRFGGRAKELVARNTNIAGAAVITAASTDVVNQALHLVHRLAGG